MDHPKEKIAFLGLDNAGKSSIIKTLMQEFEILENIKPTTKIDRTFFEMLGKDLVFWDFGGQDKFRTTYLSNPELYFSEISYLFYVFDILDPNSFDESLNYFQEIIKFLEIYSKNATLILLFHKTDPDKKEIVKSLGLKSKFLKESQSILAPLMSKTMKDDNNDLIYIFETSIYDPINIVKACSKPFLNNKNLVSVISDILFKFVTSFNLEFASLFTSNFFELGNFISDSFDIEMMNQILNQYLRIVNPSLNTIIEITFLDKPFKVIVSGFSIQFKNMLIPFYSLIIIKPQNKLKDLEIKQVIENQNMKLKKLIENADLLNIYLNSKK